MRFVAFNTDDGKILIEVSDGPAGVEPAALGRSKTSNPKAVEQVAEVSSGLADALKNTIGPNAAAIIAACRDAVLKPDKIEVTFGLKAGVEGGIAFFGVAKATAEANYTITMKWDRVEPKPELNPPANS